MMLIESSLSTSVFLQHCSSYDDDLLGHGQLFIWMVKDE